MSRKKILWGSKLYTMIIYLLYYIDMLWIITSWTENFNLIRLCQQAQINFCVIADTEARPYQDKTQAYLTQRMNILLKKSKELWCTHILISPLQELLLQYDNMDTHGQIIIPLFTQYMQYCLQHSLVGKIGFVGWNGDINQINSFFTMITKDYQLIDNQKTTKKFHLSKWTKDVSMREYFSRLYSSRNLLINKTIKEDLKYFKDANVDTLIPLNYSYFNYQRTITSYLNPKKYKFHKRDIIENIFKQMIIEKTVSLSHCLTVYYHWSLHLINDKKWKALLSQGGKQTLEYKEITL